MSIPLEVFLKYPLIINAKHTKNTTNSMLFEGKILVNNQYYTVTLQQTLIDNQIKYALKQLNPANFSTTEIYKTIENNNFSSLKEVLDTLQQFLETKSCAKSISNHCEIYRKVLYEYSEFTKFFLNLKSCKLKEDLSKIYVSVTDDKNREHSVEVSINYSNNSLDIFQITSVDLPDKSRDQFKPNESLAALFNYFLNEVELLQPFFDLMDDFDKNCTILDPHSPERRDTYRRIFLENSASTIITLDPFNVFLRPDIKFLGSTRLTEQYYIKLNENITNWVCQNDVFQGVLDLLGLECFPRRVESSKEINVLLVDYGECSICFSFRLNEKLPDITCPNKSCEKFYHNECLYNWLVALNAGRIFNSISGQCPNCEKSISCPILD